MSLSTALNIAQNSLLNTQRQTGVVSRNIANAYNPDYARRSAALTSLAPGSRIADIQRATDAALFKQNLSALSGWTAQNTIIKGLDQLNLSVNGVEHANSAATMLGKLQEALQFYAATPSNRTLAENAVEAARQMVRTLNEGTRAIQNFRADMDSQIATGVGELNTLLADFGKVNTEIVKGTASGRDVLDAYDQRDALLNRISELVPISTISRANNDIMIVTTDGTTLFETIPRHVAFEATPVYGAGAEGGRILIDGVPIQKPVGANTNAGGTLAAMMQLRDSFATGMQSQLDEIARGLIVAFAETDPTDPDNISPGLFSWDGPADMPPDGQVFQGLAGMITLNAAVDPQKAGGNPERLRDGINFTFNAENHASFSDHLHGLVNAMDKPIEFETVDGAKVTQSVMTYSAGSISWLQDARKAATGAAETKSALVLRTTEALSNITSVNLDEEMALMLELEQSYAASARMLQMIDEMLKTLLSIVR